MFRVVELSSYSDVQRIDKNAISKGSFNFRSFKSTSEVDLITWSRNWKEKRVLQ